MARITILALTQKLAAAQSESVALRTENSVLSGKVQHLEYVVTSLQDQLGDAILAVEQLSAENEALKASAPAPKPISSIRALQIQARAIAMQTGRCVRIADGSVETYDKDAGRWSAAF